MNKYKLLFVFLLMNSNSYADNPNDTYHYLEARNKTIEALYIETGLQYEIENVIKHVSQNLPSEISEIIVPSINIVFKKRIEVVYEF